MAEKILWSDRKRRLGLPISFTKYSMTETRLFIETGLFNLREDEIMLYRVRDLALMRSFGQRIFGVGTIRVVSSDKSCPDILIKNIKHSKKVKELLSENVEYQKTHRNMTTTELLSNEVN